MARKAQAETTTTEETIAISARLRASIDKVRAPFMSYVHSFGVMTASREKIAPVFMRAYAAFKKETEKSFVEFVRLLDESVGENYREHRTYRSADYLRKLANGAGERRRAKTREHGPPIATPITGLARLASTLLNLVPADQRPRLWELFSAELGWTPEQIERLQKRAEQVDPLIVVRPPRGSSLPPLKVASPPHVHSTAA